MSTKRSRTERLKKELAKVAGGRVPSPWLIRRCFRDETHETMRLRRKVFPLLCESDPLSDFDALLKARFATRIVEEFNKASAFMKYFEDHP
jgi:DNA-binding MltR family transcriptional regulator